MSHRPFLWNPGPDRQPLPVWGLLCFPKYFPSVPLPITGLYRIITPPWQGRSNGKISCGNNPVPVRCRLTHRRNRHRSQEDLITLSEKGHYLKGSSATLGLVKVKESCEQIQRYGKMEDLDGTPVEDKEECRKRLKQSLGRVKVECNRAERILKGFYDLPIPDELKDEDEGGKKEESKKEEEGSSKEEEKNQKDESVAKAEKEPGEDASKPFISPGTERKKAGDSGKAT